MKCLVIVLAFLALGFALPRIGNKRISLGHDTITIDGSLGKKAIISKVQESPGQRNVEIYMEDKTGPTKKIWFKDQTNEDQAELESQDEPTEADILIEIFEQHEGIIDDDTFEDILQKISHFVRTGHVDKTVLGILNSFHHHQDILDAVESSELRALRKLLWLLKSSDYHHKNRDIDRLIEENAVFIHQPTDQEQDEIDELQDRQQRRQNSNRLLQDSSAWTHEQKPLSLEDILRQTTQKQQLLEIGQENPFFRRHDRRHEAWITREDLFDKNFRDLNKKSVDIGRWTWQKNQDSEDKDDDLKSLLLRGEKVEEALRRALAPESTDEVTHKWGNVQSSHQEPNILQDQRKHHPFSRFSSPHQLFFNQRQVIDPVVF